MVDTERKMVKVEVDRYFEVDTYTLGQILQVVQKYIEQFGEDARVDEEFDQYDRACYYAISKMIPETDAQMSSRILREQEEEKKQEAKEREMLQKLLLRYGIPKDPGCPWSI